MKGKSSLFFLALFLMLFGAAYLASALFLPRYIEKKVLPDLGRQLSIPLQGQVYRLGLTEAAAGDLSLGDLHEPALSIGSLQAEYSPAVLLTKKLRRVRVNGLALHVKLSDGHPVIPGLPPGSPESLPADTAEQQTAGIDLPVTVENLQVQNGCLIIMSAGQRMTVPFELEMQNSNPWGRQPHYDFTLRLMPEAGDIILTGNIVPAANRGAIALAAESLDIQGFSALASGAGITLGPGRAAIRGRTEMKLSPLQLVAAELSIEPGLVIINNRPLLFGQGPGKTGAALSLTVARQQDQLQFSAEAFLREPLPVSLGVDGTLNRNGTGMDGYGNILLQLGDDLATESAEHPLVLQVSPVELRGDFLFSLDRSGFWTVELNSTDQNQTADPATALAVQYGRAHLQAASPAFKVKGKGTPGSSEIETSLTLPAVRAGYETAAIVIPAVIVRASYTRKHPAASGNLSAWADFHLDLDRGQFQRDGLKGRADISLQGNLGPEAFSGAWPLQAAGWITLTNGEIKEDGSGLTVTEVAGRIPWSWPQSGSAKSGNLKAGRIRWRNIDLGSFSGVLTHDDVGYSLEGRYDSILLAGLSVGISGQAQVAAASYDGELAIHADMTPFGPIHLGMFDPALESATFSGVLGLDGSVRLWRRSVQGSLQARLHSGNFEFTEKKYRVSNIDLRLVVPAIPELRTAPAQTLTFEEAAFGNLFFGKGRIVWQLEAGNSVFLEDGNVQWAGGTVFTSGVRISPESQEIVVPIFCDRLKLTELLRQFGVRDAEGDGTVNGRIPLRIGRKTISFADGFLYSSPGQGGSVRVAALDLLSQGIPKNTPQFAQVDFAAEALKNFQYNWVKLLLNTEGEDLVMQMQMDGKPLQPLPFIYDSRTGVLQRSDVTKEGISQAIRLDVNFRLPLNRFLGYGGKIQDIMKKIK